MAAKILLGLVGALYVLLGLYCSFLPARASKTVGFELVGGSGRSEFLTVYGGLEVAMGLVFLMPFLRPGETEFALKACLIIHACLVLFRSVGFVTFQNIGSSTTSLAIGEWVIFLATAVIWWQFGKA
ncbi:MAG: hypothetical protein KDA84_18850 [Planctomycetaceae bacterium]|nr:hypothetical protein [Planctomycetaceae bacterium]